MKKVTIPKTPDIEAKEEVEEEPPKERNYWLSSFRRKKKEIYEPKDLEGRIQSQNPFTDEGDVIFQEIQDR